MAQIFLGLSNTGKSTKAKSAGGLTVDFGKDSGSSLSPKAQGKVGKLILSILDKGISVDTYPNYLLNMKDEDRKAISKYPVTVAIPQTEEDIQLVLDRAKRRGDALNFDYPKVIRSWIGDWNKTILPELKKMFKEVKVISVYK